MEFKIVAVLIVIAVMLFSFNLILILILLDIKDEIKDLKHSIKQKSSHLF